VASGAQTMRSDGRTLTTWGKEDSCVTASVCSIGEEPVGDQGGGVLYLTVDGNFFYTKEMESSGGR